MDKSAEIKNELKRDYERWTDILLDRRKWYKDQQIRLVDKTKESIIFYSSVAGVFLTIAAPIIGLKSQFIIVSFWAFLLNVLLGVFLVGITIFIDEKELPKAKNEEISVFKKLQLAALKGVNDPTIENLQNYIDTEKRIISEIEDKETSGLIGTIINVLYYVFLFSFIIGFGGLFLYFYNNNSMGHITINSNILNSLGLALDVIAALLLWKFGLPEDIKRTGTSNLETEQVDQKEAEKAIKYDVYSRLAIILLIIGFIIQLISNFV